MFYKLNRNFFQVVYFLPYTNFLFSIPRHWKVKGKEWLGRQKVKLRCHISVIELTRTCKRYFLLPPLLEMLPALKKKGCSGERQNGSFKSSRISFFHWLLFIHRTKQQKTPLSQYLCGYAQVNDCYYFSYNINSRIYLMSVVFIFSYQVNMGINGEQ